jgi:hypothetical protein
MTKRKTLEEKIQDAMLESGAVVLAEAEGGKVAGAESEDIDGVTTGKKAAAKVSKAKFPTATEGEKTTPKQGDSKDATFEEVGSDEVGKAVAAKVSKAGLKDAQGAGTSKAGYVDVADTFGMKLKEQIENLLGEELDLSDEFKAKAAGLFEASVIARSNEAINEFKTSLQEQFDNELIEAIEDVSDKVDSYLSFAVNEWAKDNQLALEKGIRTELAESFIANLHTVFSEHFITVPEGKEDLVESLQEKNESLTEMYNTSVKTAMDTAKEINELKRTITFAGLTEGLAASEIDKLAQLVEGIEFESAEDYSDKVAVIKESFFNKPTSKKPVISEDKRIVGSDPIVEAVKNVGYDQISNAIRGMNSFRK